MHPDPYSLREWQADALGRRLLAAGCPWRAGMLTLPTNDGTTWRCMGKMGWKQNRWACESMVCRYMYEGVIPDLRDAATRGAVLEALRERTGLWLYTEPRPWVQDSLAAGDPVQWFVCKMGGLALYSSDGSTEEEALVLAWEEAPTQRRG